ncbi:MAG: hypothetical protein JW832_11960, partial [Deltaproteobacteria bacterium]|nr:hypothetical protein [Deltaproteobacteria bacterium]
MKHIRQYAFLLLTVFFLAALVCPHAALSSDEALVNGVTWLVDNQTPDNGAWGSDTVRETATVVDVLKNLEPTGAAYSNGVGYLKNTEALCTDHVSRRIASLAGAGQLNQIDVDLLLNLQNPDGGFGFAAGWPSSVADSLFAAQALAEAGNADTTSTGKLLSYLTQNQNADGSFGFISGEGNLYLTAYAAQVFSKYLLRYATLKPYSESALAFLSGFNQENGCFTSPDASPVVTTALAARALIAAGGSAMTLLNARLFISDQQQENGSWEDDPVATALALQALWHDASQEENPDNGTSIDPDVPRPNLTIAAGNIRLIPAHPVDGERATVTFTVLNTGSAAAQHVDVALYAESPLNSGATVLGRLGSPVASIAPESSVVVSISWTVVRKTGREAVYLFVDPDNIVNNESNKNDNIASSEFTVSTIADLSISPTDITFDNPAPFEGEAFTMSALIRNIGETDVGPVTVNVYKIAGQESALIGALNYSGIAGGSFAAADINLRLNAGTYAFAMEALPVDAVSSNNRAQASITVRAAGFRGIDLSVSAAEILISQDNPASDGPIIIQTIIRNLGDQDASNVTVTMYDGDPDRLPDPYDPEDKPAVYLASWTFVAIIEGGYKSVSTQRYGCLQPGNHEIYVVVDPVSGELSRINNTAHKAVTVFEPDQSVELSIASDNITFDPAEPQLGDMVAINCNFRNNGDLPVRNLKVRVYTGNPETGGAELCPEVLFPYINPRSTNTLTINKDTTGWGGEHALYVLLDPDNSTGDTNRNDNRASRQLSVAVPPGRDFVDLAIEGGGISVTPPDPVWGTVVQLNCPVHNYGTEPSEGAVVEFFNGNPDQGGTLIDNLTIDTSLNPGDTANASVQWDMSGKAGQQTVFVRVFALPAGTTESNIFNNSAETSIGVKAPDLSIQSEDISYTPAQPLAGEPLNIQCRIRNIGNEPAGGYTVNLYKDNIDASDLIASISKPGIAAGDSDNISFQWIAPSAEGAYKMHIVVLPDAPDANSSNNTARRTVYTTTLADLTIDDSSITVELRNPDINDLITIRAEIKNTGGIFATGARVGFYDGVPAEDDSNRIGDEHSITVYGHSSEFVDKTIFLTTAGTHTIYVVVNRSGSIHESSYTNNQASFQVFVSALADLSVASNEIDVSPAAPGLGDTVSISAIVRNHSDQVFHDVMVRFYDGDPAMVSAVLVDVKQTTFFANEVKQISGHYEGIGGGMHELWVAVEEQAGEAEIGNNRAYRSVAVPSPDQPDLYIGQGQLTFSPIRPMAGESVTITAMVTNYSESAAQEAQVLFYDEMPGSDSAQLIGKATRDIVTGKAEVSTVFTEGQHEIYAVVEPVLNEANLNNNTAKATITVSTLVGFYDDCGNPDNEPHLYQDPQGQPQTIDIRIDNVTQENFEQSITASMHPALVQYRYTGLNPKEYYQVVVNYLQELGSGRVQRLSADNRLLHDALALPEQTARYFTYDLPFEIYGDGTVTISFEKVSGPNVLVSEIFIVEKQNKKDEAVWNGTNWLVRHQHENGGWQDYDSCLNNAYALHALALTESKYMPEYLKIKKRVYEMQATNGSWGSVQATAYSIVALLADGENADSLVIQNAVGFLKRVQSTDGSWGANSITTGIAMLALINADKQENSGCVQAGRDWLLGARNSDDGYWGEIKGQASSTAIGWYPVAALKLAGGVDPLIITKAVAYYKLYRRGGQVFDASSYLSLLYYTGGSQTEINAMHAYLVEKQLIDKGSWSKIDPTLVKPDVKLTAEVIIALWQTGKRDLTLTKGIQSFSELTTPTGDCPLIYEYGTFSSYAALALQFTDPQG